jgi:hypothetical protein
MPAMYTTVTVNVTQVNNENDQLPRVQSNDNNNITRLSPYIRLADASNFCDKVLLFVNRILSLF